MKSLKKCVSRAKCAALPVLKLSFSKLSLIRTCHTLYDPPRTSARLPLYRQDESETIVKRPWGSQRDTRRAASETNILRVSPVKILVRG